MIDLTQGLKLEGTETLDGVAVCVKAFTKATQEFYVFGLRKMEN